MPLVDYGSLFVSNANDDREQSSPNFISFFSYRSSCFLSFSSRSVIKCRRTLKSSVAQSDSLCHCASNAPADDNHSFRLALSRTDVKLNMTSSASASNRRQLVRGRVKVRKVKEKKKKNSDESFLGSTTQLSRFYQSRSKESGEHGQRAHATSAHAPILVVGAGKAQVTFLHFSKCSSFFYHDGDQRK